MSFGQPFGAPFGGYSYGFNAQPYGSPIPPFTAPSFTAPTFTASQLPAQQGQTVQQNQQAPTQVQGQIPPAFPQQGFPQQGFPGFPPQPQGFQQFPQQGFPQQGFPQQGFPQQGFPQQGFPGFPQVPPQQAFPGFGQPQGFPQGFPQQAPQGFPQQSSQLPQFSQSPLGQGGFPFFPPQTSPFPFFPEAAQSQKVVLTYFAGKGLCEPIRLLLAEAGVDYEENLIDSKEKWDALKPTLPYGQVPLLEIDGLRLVQSRAIANYLGNKFGFYGFSIDEKYAIDELIESINDFKAKAPMLWDQGADFQEKLAAFREKDAAKYFSIWDKKIQANGGRHVVGQTLSLADVYLWAIVRVYTVDLPGMEGALNDYPALRHLLDSIESRPRIEKYLKSEKCYPWRPTPEYRANIMKILGRA